MARPSTSCFVAVVAILGATLVVTPGPAASEPVCTATFQGVSWPVSVWDDPGSWVDGVVPDADDHVCIPAGTEPLWLMGSATIASLTMSTAGGSVGWPVLMVGGSEGDTGALTVTGTAVVVGELLVNADGSAASLSAGSLDVQGRLALMGPDDAVVTAGSVEVSGRVDVMRGGDRTLAAPVDVVAGGAIHVSDTEHLAGVEPLTSAGRIRIGHDASLFTTGPVTITDGVVDLQGSLSSLVLDGGRLIGDGHVAGSLTNHAGTIDPSGGPSDPAGPVGTITASGAITQTGGVLHLDVLGPGADEHDLVTSDAVASIAGTVDVSALAVPQPDVVVVSAASLDLAATYEVTGVPTSWVQRTSGQLLVAAQQFRTDVPLDHPFVLDIASAVGAGVMVGYDDGTWRPSTDMTRQALAAVLYRMAGSPRGPAPTCDAMPFPDVLADHAFCGEIDWAGDAGLLRGYDDGTFRPTHPATRQALVASLYRLGGEPDGADPACTAPPFTDVPVTHPFCGELAWAEEVGVVEGYAYGRARPSAVLTRQATAAMAHRFDLLPPAALG